jgi:hypothetical protein
VQELEEPLRRAADFTDDGSVPTIADAWQRARLAHKRISLLEADIEKLKRAFLKDDLGTPDTEGHRKSHAELVESAKLVKEYKVGMTKDMLKVLSGAAFTAFILGIISYLKDHLK